MWSTGITVWYGYAGSHNGIERYGWAGSLDWHANASNGSPIEGTIHTRYFEDTLEKAIDMVIEMADRFGVKFHPQEEAVPYLYYKGDGEDKENKPPENWRQLLNAEARRRKWASYKVNEFGFESFAVKTDEVV